jgi:hypothetical protein
MPRTSRRQRNRRRPERIRNRYSSSRNSNSPHRRRVPDGGQNSPALVLRKSPLSKAASSRNNGQGTGATSSPVRKSMLSRQSARRMDSRCIKWVPRPILTSRLTGAAVKASNSSAHRHPSIEAMGNRQRGRKCSAMDVEHRARRPRFRIGCRPQAQEQRQSFVRSWNAEMLFARIELCGGRLVCHTRGPEVQEWWKGWKAPGFAQRLSISLGGVTYNSAYCARSRFASSGSACPAI